MLMDEQASTTADTLELLLLNQVAIRAALEELSLWESHRGSVNIHEIVMAALTTLDIPAEAISTGIARLKARAATTQGTTTTTMDHLAGIPSAIQYTYLSSKKTNTDGAKRHYYSQDFLRQSELGKPPTKL